MQRAALLPELHLAVCLCMMLLGSVFLTSSDLTYSLRIICSVALCACCRELNSPSPLVLIQGLP